MAKYPRHNQQNSPRPPQVLAQATQTQWSGPLPPPEVLQKFDTVIVGGAERILRMAENEQQHRITQESVGLQAAIQSDKIGKYLGFGIAVAAIFGAVAVVYVHGAWQVSVALVGVPVLTVAYALIAGQKKEAKEESQVSS
jgi:uncharacterized membrane protein